MSLNSVVLQCCGDAECSVVCEFGHAILVLLCFLCGEQCDAMQLECLAVMCLQGSVCDLGTVQFKAAIY